MVVAGKLELESVEKGYNEWPVKNILRHSGLDLLDLQGKKVLDLGCGKNALLVNYLRENGVMATGVDRELITHGTNDYLIRGWTHDVLGGVATASFDFGVAHMSVFKGGCDYFIDKAIEVRGEVDVKALYVGELVQQVMTVMEIGRILNPRGRLIIFPYPNDLVRSGMLQSQIPGIEINKVHAEAVDERLNLIYAAVDTVDFERYPELLQRAEISFS